MKPGRELDQLVAEKVFGSTEAKPYSTDIAAAWRVVEKHNQIVSIWQGRPSLDRNAHGMISRRVWERGDPVVYRVSVAGRHTAYSETAPHAICLAALKALGHNLSSE